MNAQTAKTIEAIVAAARRRQPAIAKRFMLRGSDGQYYSFGMPAGVHSTGERSAPYYVRTTREGTTVGARFESREALQADLDRVTAVTDSKFRAELLNMTPEQLASQAAYWLDKGGAK